MNNARQVTQDGEQDVDEQISTASAFEEYANRRQDDGKNDLEDVTVPDVLAPLVDRGLKSIRVDSKAGVDYLPVKGMLAVLKS